MYYIDPNNYWRDDLDDRPVMVSIHCLVYNHEKFIRDALEGFVNQKTNFRFEAIVHDDASTDGSAAIIKEYAEKYPSIIKPIFETENQHSKHDGSLGRIMNTHLRGKYVAMCEGDDYWTDPMKLQKQVDFLEANPDYSMCFHSAIVHDEDSKEPDHYHAKLETREYTLKDTADNWIVATASMVFRREILDSKIYNKVLKSEKLLVGDTALERTCGAFGRFYAFGEPMSVYRLHSTGATKALAKMNMLPLVEQEAEYIRIFGGYSTTIGKIRIGKYSTAVYPLIAKGRLKDAFKLFNACIKYAPIQSLSALSLSPFKFLSKKLKK